MQQFADTRRYNVASTSTASTIDSLIQSLAARGHSVATRTIHYPLADGLIDHCAKSLVSFRQPDALNSIASLPLQ
jgi:hypothetical protein